MSEGEAPKKRGRAKKGEPAELSARATVHGNVTAALVAQLDADLASLKANRVWPPVYLDVATAPADEAGTVPPATLEALAEPYIERVAAAGWRARTLDTTPGVTRFAEAHESADGVEWIPTGRYVLYPLAPLTVAEAEAEGARLRAGMEAAAMAALDEVDATLERGEAPPNRDWAADEVREYLEREAGLPPGDERAAPFVAAYVLDLLTVVVEYTQAESALLRKALDAAGVEVDTGEPKRRGRSDLTAYTSPPVAVLEQAVADMAAEGARLRAADKAGRELTPGVSGGSNFALADGNRRLVHTRSKAGYMVAVDYADPVGSIEEVLREAGAVGGLEGVFLVAAAVFHALEYGAEQAATPGAVPEPVHAEDVLLDIGWQRDRDGVRESRADALERVAGLYLRLNGWTVEGTGWGTFKGKDGALIDASSRGPLFTTTVVDNPQGTLTGERRPVGFVFMPGDFLTRAAANPVLLPAFGTYRELARMPRTRPADAWGVAIGMALVQRWRELAAHTRVTKAGDANKPVIHAQKVTRRYLLSQYPPQPDPVDVLADREHGTRNAKAYWRKALANLKARGVIDADVERRLQGDPASLPRRGWGEAWLNERLDVRPPAGGYEAEFLTLSAGARAHTAKTRRQERRRKA